MTFDDVLKTALLGTGRAALPTAPPADAALAQSLASIGDGPPEDRLFALAAVLSAYESCGRTSPITDAVPAVAAPDRRAECSAKAGSLLRQLLDMTDTPGKKRLLLDWLNAAAGAGKRPPHDTLPELLEYARGHRACRQIVVDAVDQRGAWLMSLAPWWQFASAEGDNPADVWSTGNKEQRATALRRLRETDPAAARELVESTWKVDGADERTSFVEILRVNLSAADEPFLESALDDRSKLVKAAAADLLSRLPSSALVQRMTDRATPLLVFTPPEKGGLLKRGKSAAVDVVLPPETFDATWARDGVIEKPDGRVGKRQWWLRQLLAAVPPSHWAKTWNLPAADAIAAVAGDHRELVLDAWTDAAERHREVDWLEPLLLRALFRPNATVRLDLIELLPEERRRVLLKALLKSPKSELHTLTSAFDALSGTLDAELTDLAIEAVEKQVGQKSTYHYYLATLLEPLSHRLPPDIAERLSHRWTGPAWDVNRKALDVFFSTLQIRKTIATEFST